MKKNKLMQLLSDNVQKDASERPSIRSQAGDNCIDIYLYDVIDPMWGASAPALLEALKAAGSQPVCIHINSPGGDVFEARAMAAAIATYPGPVEACIDGICASAATYVALAAGTVCMVEGAMLMIHNSWTVSYGDKEDLRSTADLLEKIDGTINLDYSRRTGASTEQVTKWMDAETWFTASEALAAKFIDAIEPNTQKGDSAEPTARWNLSAYANAPQITEPPKPEPDLSAQIAAQLQHNRNRLQLLAQADPI